MANRYLRATGNWNGPVWAETSGGTAGTAATPTSADIVYIIANFTVTLTEDAVGGAINFSNGRINLASYTLDLRGTYGGFFRSYGTSARTIDMGSGTLIMGALSDNKSQLLLYEGSDLTIIPGTSRLIFESRVLDDAFKTGSHTFNDVEVRLGSGVSTSSLYITGSPTFRLLDIRSANSAAHTVSFDDDVYVNKLVVIGQSVSSRLTVNNTDGKCFIFGEDNIATTYGQFVDMRMQAASNIYYDDPTNPTYIGNNSITNTTGWMLQDPPKISTLVDQLTIEPGSNSKWMTGGTVTQVSTGAGGGGYNLSSGSSILSTDVFDLTESSIFFERTVDNPTDGDFGVLALGDDLSNTTSYVAAWSWISGSPPSYDVAYWSGYNDERGGGDSCFEYPISTSKYVKIGISGNNLAQSVSDDAINWTVVWTNSLTDFELSMYKACRVVGFRGSQYIGSVNVIPETPASTNTGSFLQFFM